MIKHQANHTESEGVPLESGKMRRDGASNAFIMKRGSEARKSQKACTALAENEEWLVENADKLGSRSST